jgi:DNA primase
MAGRIPQEFLDQLLGRVDLVEIVNSRVPLRRAGHEFMACCPFHAEKTPSFSVSPRKQFYHCFGCGAHGNAIGFLMAYERLEFPDAVEELARQTGLELPKTEGGDGVSIKPLLLELGSAGGSIFPPSVAGASQSAAGGGLSAPTRPDRADRERIRHRLCASRLG